MDQEVQLQCEVLSAATRKLLRLRCRRCGNRGLDRVPGWRASLPEACGLEALLSLPKRDSCSTMGVYALATLPLAVALLILILGVVTLVVSLVFAIVGLTRLQKRLHRDYARISKSSRTINKEKIEFITEEYQDTIYSTIIDYDNLVKDIGHLKRLLSNSTSVYHNQESALAIRSKKTVLEIEADFDGRSTEFYTIEAVGGPVHFWTYFVSTDARSRSGAHAGWCPLFDARFTSGNGSMIVIPTLNRLREKEFALFLLIRQSRGEDGVRL